MYGTGRDMEVFGFEINLSTQTMVKAKEQCSTKWVAHSLTPKQPTSQPISEKKLKKFVSSETWYVGSLSTTSSPPGVQRDN